MCLQEVFLKAVLGAKDKVTFDAGHVLGLMSHQPDLVFKDPLARFALKGLIADIASGLVTRTIFFCLLFHNRQYPRCALEEALKKP